MNREREIPRLVFVAGFLGAGKTTLITYAARLLSGRGTNVAVITNDQSSELVDTEWARWQDLQTAEIAGGCFCCRFDELVEAARGLVRFGPDVIFAEPVGSCMDLSATVLQPLKAVYGGELQLAPLTVLVDAGTADRMQEEPDSLLAYLFRNQIAEADLVCLTKTDLGLGIPDVGGGIDFQLSARTGDGVDAWLRQVLAGTQTAGGRLLDIDYQQYSDAEASLGWLNWSGDVLLEDPKSAAPLIGPLLDDLDGELTRRGIRIAHLKVLDRAGAGFLKASVCRNQEEPMVMGDLMAPASREHRVLVNLRAEGEPAELREVVEAAFAALGGRVTVHVFDSFRPAPPKPQHRFEEVVG